MGRIKWGQKKIEIQMLTWPAQIRFQLQPPKYYLPDRRVTFVLSFVCFWWEIIPNKTTKLPFSFAQEKNPLPQIRQSELVIIYYSILELFVNVTFLLQ